MLDIIGTIYTTPVYDEEFNIVEEAQPLPGYHVNSPELVDGWEQYQAHPSTPMRVFAGHSTFFYVFPDQAAFEAAAIEVGLIQPEEV